MEISEIQEAIFSKESELRTLKSLLEEATKDKIYCSGCDSYWAKDQVMVGSFTETKKGECVFTDCGYGDDDEFADVTYNHIITRCPKCGQELSRQSIWMKETNRHDRYGNKS